ncbi:Na/Pi symporter [Corynebacterium sp. 22KM0430]|uniref:Na/Pi symporter n=1 Tax=Corynebacterium sp. 22KM0430 TaxID=2989735 RepID=UPI0029C9DC33|nr:Na/Pi symporter [Corynebacterium sp. 22KM0430]WPF65895.1 Na/Pi symporter [Corynebacterium sp. 22KM0430]
MVSQTTPILGTQHYMNPKDIAPHEDMIMLSTAGKLIRCAGVIAAILSLFLGLYLVVDGIYGMSSGYAQRVFSSATHPLIGLVLGILAAALLQSSSAATALTVAAVGTGAISVPVAIPLIMGANIGTTLTALAASFSYGHRNGARYRALSAAFLHAWFNVLMVAVFLPLELLFHPLQALSHAVTNFFLPEGHHGLSSEPTIIGPFTPLIEAIGTQGLLGRLFPTVSGLACALLGALLILLGLRTMRALLRTLFAATTLSALERTVGGSGVAGVATGALGTAVIQSSTVTIISLLPFAATRSLKQREALFLILGANVGTTVGVLLAFAALPHSPLGAFALQAAFVHVIFNLMGTTLVVVIPALRRALLRTARLSAHHASKSAPAALAVLLAAYCALPALILGLWAANN